MPLGDPHGGNFTYTDEGIPKGVGAVAIPTKDLDRSIHFYTEILKMRLLSRDESKAILAVGKDVIIIEKNEKTAVDTGLYLRTESPFDLHRRMVDEGVIFVLEPKRTELGLETSFRDDDGNIIHAIEMR